MDSITVTVDITAPIEKVWDFFTLPEHIIHWNYASEDWCSPSAENDLHEMGHFSYRMEAKDGSMGFDFGGVYQSIKVHEQIDYLLDDHRKVSIRFIREGDSTKIIEQFEPERENTLELQELGWQAILNNFKKYTEATEAIV